MTTYEKELRKLAEEMAAEEHNKGYRSAMYDRDWPAWVDAMKERRMDKIVEVEINKHLPLAAIALRYAAGKVRETHSDLWCGDPARTSADYIHSLGLTPAI